MVFQDGPLLRHLLNATQGKSKFDSSQLPKSVQQTQFLESLESANLLEPGVDYEWSFCGFAKVQVAIRALQLGEATRPILNSLTWQEFEEFVAHVLTFHEFQVKHRFRFSLSRRYEIDIVAGRNPFLLCIDCKQFGVRLGKASTLRTASEKQVIRTHALANHLAQFQADLGILDWQDPLLLPVLVTMLLEDLQFHEGIPVVPAVNLNSFLLGFEEQLDQLRIIHPSASRQTRLF
ncbi:MAG: hypothetical protein ACFE89_11240 [Candidatus Hodarchaeota archaeon]